MVVLIIEDSSAMRQLIAHGLRRIAGVVVIEATHGLEGLEKLTEIVPDVILTDINMPVMDGFTFLERLRQLPNHATTPVIVLTTEGADEDRERARALGVTTYVTKPIRQQDLIAAIQSVGEVTTTGTPSSEQPEIVLRVDYASADDLLGDYAATLSRGEIVVSNGRALSEGTHVRLALAFPSLAEPIHLDGVVRSTRPGDEPTLDVVLTDPQQRDALAHVIERIRAAR